MYQKIVEYVDDVFKELPDNTVVGFAKKGFIASITKKYEENIGKGFSQEESFNNAVAQFPEIRSVANDMKKYMGKRKTAHYRDDEFNFAAQSGFCDDNDEQRHGTARKPFDDFDEDKKAKRIVGNFSSIFWPLVLCAYFLVSFTVSGAWAYSWAIFIMAAAVQCIVKLCLCKTKAARIGAVSSILWLVASTVYIAVSFITSLWQYTWIIFIFAAAVQCLISLIYAKTLAAKQGAVGGIIWLLAVVAYLIVSFLTSAWNISWIIFIFAVAVSSVARIIVEKIYLNK